MRRIIVVPLLAMMVSMLAVLGTATPAGAAVTYYCRDKIDKQDLWFNDGPNDLSQVTVMYKFCAPSDPDYYAYVKPYRVIGAYNASGSHMSCNSMTRRLDGFRFNFYFWRPYTGANFNPGAFTVPCDESTLNSRTQTWRISNVPRLWFGPGSGDDRQPRWKVNVTRLRNFDADDNKSWAQDFKPFS